MYVPNAVGTFFLRSTYLETRNPTLNCPFIELHANADYCKAFKSIFTLGRAADLAVPFLVR